MAAIEVCFFMYRAVLHILGFGCVALVYCNALRNGWQLQFIPPSSAGLVLHIFIQQGSAPCCYIIYLYSPLTAHAYLFSLQYSIAISKRV